jgi:hypothetical protein
VPNPLDNSSASSFRELLLLTVLKAVSTDQNDQDPCGYVLPAALQKYDKVAKTLLRSSVPEAAKKLACRGAQESGNYFTLG